MFKMKGLLIVTCMLLFESIHCESVQRVHRQDPAWWGDNDGAPAQTNGAPPNYDGLDNNGLQQGTDLDDGEGLDDGDQQGQDIGQDTGEQQDTDGGQDGTQEDAGGDSSWFNWFNNWFNKGGKGNEDDNDDYYNIDYNNSTNLPLNTTDTGSDNTTGTTVTQGGTSITQDGNSLWSSGLLNAPTAKTTTSNTPQQNNQANNWWSTNWWNHPSQTETTIGAGSTSKPPTQFPWQNQGQQQQGQGLDLSQNNFWPPQQSAVTTGLPNPGQGQQGAWQGPAASPAMTVTTGPVPWGTDQGQTWENQEQTWENQGQTTANFPTSNVGSTTSSVSTTTMNPCALEKVSLDNACIYTNPPPSAAEGELTLRDVYESIFDEAIIEDLILVCPPGQWCLQDSKFFNPLQEHDYDMFCNYSVCLEDASLQCNTDERTIVTSSLKTLCAQNKLNMTNTCNMKVKMMLHVTMADLRRRQRTPDQEICGVQMAASDRCGDTTACVEEAKSFSCLNDECLTEDARQIWALIPQWQWYYWDPVFMRETCQITNATECQDILPTPTPQRYVFFVQFDNMDGRVMTGLFVVLIVSLVGFSVAVWACVRKLSLGYSRDRIQYTEVKPEYFDTV